MGSWHGPKRCKDAKELKERLTAWSLKVAEFEHQFKVIDEAQKIFVVREMMPKDIKREFLTGPRKNEMMADDGPLPMDLVRHWLEKIQGRQGSRQEGTEWIRNMASWERS